MTHSDCECEHSIHVRATTLPGSWVKVLALVIPWSTFLSRPRPRPRREVPRPKPSWDQSINQSFYCKKAWQNAHLASRTTRLVVRSLRDATSANRCP